MGQRSDGIDTEFGQLVDMSLDAVCIAGFDGYLTRVNPAFCQMLGYTEEELLSRPWINNVYPEDREMVEAAVATLADGVVIRGLKCRQLCADGSVRWVEWNTHATTAEGVVYAIGRDITDQRRGESEQAALQRVATLVAEGMQPSELFTVVAAEVADVTGVPVVTVARYDPGDTVTVCASVSPQGAMVETGTRWPLEETHVANLVRQRSAPARIDGDSGLRRELADAVGISGIRSTVGAPILVAGRLWGLVTASGADRLPENTDATLVGFTVLLATAIANAESRKALAEVVEEQSALRRLATLVAEGVPSTELFSALTKEVAHVFSDVDPSLVASVVRFDPGPENVLVGASRAYEQEPLGARWAPKELYVSTRVLRTGRSARVDEADLDTSGGPDADVLRLRGFLYQVGSPVVVEGQLWGAVCLNSKQELPQDTDERLQSFTELVATAIANAESREDVARLVNEQAALRLLATLVAKGVPPTEIFAEVSSQVGDVFALEVESSDVATVVRFDPGPECVLVGASNSIEGLPLGSRWAPTDLYVSTRVLRTGHSARVDEMDLDVGGPAADTLRRQNLISQAGSPIIVEGRLWGAITVNAKAVLPPDTEKRLEKFTELVATAIANAEAREARVVLTEEQAALRRVATLVADGTPPSQVFDAAAREVANALGIDMVTIDRYDPDGASTVVASFNDPGFPVGSRWPHDGPSLGATVFETGRPARFEDYAELQSSSAAVMRERSVSSAVGAPILVEGRPWGVICVSTALGPSVPEGVEARLADFTELLATSIARTESREALARIAEEQAALRRVATLVAEAAAPRAILDAVAGEMQALLDADQVALNRFEPNAEIVVLAHRGLDVERTPVGSRVSHEGENVTSIVRRTGIPARMENYEEAGGALAELARATGLHSSVSAPITVEGQVWGVVTASWKGDESPPADTEDRMAKFAHLIDTAIANTEARAEVEQLAEEQAALRHVATLVARDAPSTEVFEAVATEVGRLLDTDVTVVGRYDGDGAATAIGSWSASGGGVPVGTRSEIGGHNVLTIVAETGKPARVDEYDDASGEAAEIARRYGWRSSIAAPIVVEGRLWGVMLVATQRPEPFPVGAEERLAAFTDLVATAVANTEARHALEQIAAEQETLRRIATMVARGVRPDEVFAVVIEEVGRLFGTELTTVGRFRDDPPAFVSVALGKGMHGVEVGTSWALNDRLTAGRVFQSGRSVRVNEGLRERSPALADMLARVGVVSTVASPIMLEGRIWGAVLVSSKEELPAGLEQRLEKFAELVATAIANAEGKSELAASRRRIVAASDDARRRIERDLHDGVQQQLVSLSLEVGRMEAGLPAEDALKEPLGSVSESVGSILDSLGEIARGIHPSILSQGGLEAALNGLARRSAVPVELDAQIDGALPDEVEVAAYYVASEALTNVAKHARASVVHVDVTTDNGTLTLDVRDDGVGGADLSKGSGLVGLQDRIEALGGTIAIDSTAGQGTCIVATLPVASKPDEEIEDFLVPPHSL